MTQLDNRKEPSQGHVGGSEAQEREAFEAWARDRGWNLKHYPPNGDRYSSVDTTAGWQAWLARATAAAPAAPVRQDEQEPFWHVVVSEDAPVMNKAIRRADVADEYAQKCRGYGYTVEVVPLYKQSPAAHPPAAVGQALEALTPFAALFDKREAEYRKRGGDLSVFGDGHPAFDIEAKRLPLGVWRKARAAIAALSVQAEVPAVVDDPSKALRDAATSLETISSLAGRKSYGNPPIETYMDTFMDVRLYAAARARVARETLAAMRAADTKEGPPQ